jgi:D-glycero-alpha-D-manno-heptose 1-phosphate guanylyltransferase
MEAIILAGGLGTRLGSRLADLPKAMAPVAGRPFLALLLDRLIAVGCERAILAVGYRRDAIIGHFQQSYRGLPLIYTIEEQPLGTGGAIRLSLEQVTDSSALVLNGDTFLDLEPQEICAYHRSTRRSMTMAVTQVADTSRYGGVLLRDNTITGFTEKGRHGAGWINAGVYVLDRNFAWPHDLPAQFSFEKDVLGPHIETLRPAAFQCRGYFLDIGVPEDLDRAQIELRERGKS